MEKKRGPVRRWLEERDTIIPRKKIFASDSSPNGNAVFKVIAGGQAFVIGADTAHKAALKIKDLTGIKRVDRIFELVRGEWVLTPWREAEPLPRVIYVKGKKLVKMVHPQKGEMFVESEYVEDMKHLGWVQV